MTNETADTQDLAKCRREFEEWFAAPRTLERNGDGYKFSTADYAWRIWQGCVGFYAKPFTDEVTLGIACEAFTAAGNKKGVISLSDQMKSALSAIKAYYTPKLTNAEAVWKAMLAYQQESSAQMGEPFYEKDYEEYKKRCPNDYAEDADKMICALRAAGMKFKEDV